MKLDDETKAALAKLGTKLATEAVERYAMKRLSRQTKAETLAAIKAVEAARRIRSTDDLLGEGEARE